MKMAIDPASNAQASTARRSSHQVLNLFPPAAPRLGSPAGDI